MSKRCQKKSKPYRKSETVGLRRRSSCVFINSLEDLNPISSSIHFVGIDHPTVLSDGIFYSKVYGDRASQIPNVSLSERKQMPLSGGNCGTKNEGRWG
jgi:hypothetical protein